MITRTPIERFRKRPVVIEAFRWHAHDRLTVEDELVRYYRLPGVPGDNLCSECGLTMHVHGWVDTLEEGHRVCPGDWIIKGVEGEFYPCKPGIFEKTYDLLVGE